MKCETCQGFGRVALPMPSTMISPGVSVGNPVHREGPCQSCEGNGEAVKPTDNSLLSDETCKAIIKRIVEQAAYRCACGHPGKVYLQPKPVSLRGVNVATGTVLDVGLCCVAVICQACGGVQLFSAELLGVKIGDEA